MLRRENYFSTYIKIEKKNTGKLKKILEMGRTNVFADALDKN